MIADRLENTLRQGINMEDCRAPGDWQEDDWTEEDPKFPMSAYMEYRGFIPDGTEEFVLN